MKKNLCILLCLNIFLSCFSVSVSAYVDEEYSFTGIIDTVEYKTKSTIITFSDREYTRYVTTRYTIPKYADISYFKDGKTASLSDLTHNSVFTVYYNDEHLNYADNVRFEISTNTVCGQPESIDFDTCTINGKEYTFCDYVDYLSSDTRYIFTLDKNGKIAKASPDYQSSNYAVFDSAQTDTDGEIPIARVNMVTFDGENKTFVCDNGELIDLVLHMKNGSLVNYTSDGDKLTSIKEELSRRFGGRVFNKKTSSFGSVKIGENTKILNLIGNTAKTLSYKDFCDQKQYSFVYSGDLLNEDGSVVLLALTGENNNILRSDSFGIISQNKNGELTLTDRHNRATVVNASEYSVGDIVSYSKSINGDIIINSVISLPAITWRGIKSSDAADHFSSFGINIHSGVPEWDYYEDSGVLFGEIQDSGNGFITIGYELPQGEKYEMCLRADVDCRVFKFNCANKTVSESSLDDMTRSYENDFKNYAVLKLYKGNVTDVCYIPTIIAQEKFNKQYKDSNAVKFEYNGTDKVFVKYNFPIFETPKLYAAAYSGERMTDVRQVGNEPIKFNTPSGESLRFFAIDKNNKPYSVPEPSEFIHSEQLYLSKPHSVTLKAADIAEVQNNTLTASNSKIYKLSEAFSVYINDYYIKYADLSKYISSASEVTLEDTYFTGKYDTVKLKCPVTARVSKVQIQGSLAKIYFDNSPSVTLYLDDYHSYKLIKDDAPASIGDIAAGDILTLYYNTAEDFVQSKNAIICINTPFEAKISDYSYAENGKNVTINGKEYFLPSAVSQSVPMYNLIFAADAENNIVDISEIDSDEKNYGIIDKVWRNSDDDYMIRLITKNGERTGYTVSAAESYEKAMSIAYKSEYTLNDINDRIATYDLNSKNQITSIRTVNSVYKSGAVYSGNRFQSEKLSENAAMISLCAMREGDWNDVDNYLSSDIKSAQSDDLTNEKAYNVILADKSPNTGEYRFAIILSGLADGDLSCDTHFSVFDYHTAVTDENMQVKDVISLLTANPNVMQEKFTTDENTAFKGYNEPNKLLKGDLLVNGISKKQSILMSALVFSPQSLFDRNKRITLEKAEEFLSSYPKNKNGGLATLDLWNKNTSIYTYFGIPVKKSEYSMEIADISKNQNGEYVSADSIQFNTDPNNINVFVLDVTDGDMIYKGKYADIDAVYIPQGCIDDNDSYLWSKTNEYYDGEFYPGYVFCKAVDGEITDIYYIMPKE